MEFDLIIFLTNVDKKLKVKYQMESKYSNTLRYPPSWHTTVSEIQAFEQMKTK